MKKAIMLILTLLVLGGCSSNQSQNTSQPTHSYDYIQVYNNSGEKIVTLTNKKAIGYFSDEIGSGGGNAKMHKVPHGSKLKLKYVGHQKNSNITSTWFVYTNKYVKLNPLKHLPTSVWKLDQHDYGKFSSPYSFN
ncbi:hypothetical protein ABC628_09120 [Lentilactobacillus otakiensis]|nr:hypothetical protein [Lentilactobacillus otakiensis]MBZ3776950.1 hypothetical protein [Lentilactobacillus otakiensis]MDV3517870.1 hypothetical protein [Lentilactobacillus otakiensis]